ncbi:MAG: NUDIX hydrolase [Leptospirales bacterium]|nr:NUDIX hydrolase [Leptospirales bacterium]
MMPGFFQITLKLFLLRGQEMLILRDRDSQLGDLPGGRISADEIYQPFARSLAREIQEELGDIAYNLEPDPIFLFPHRIQNGNHPALGIAFMASFKSGNIVLSDEHDWMAWVDVQTYIPAPLFKEHLLDAVVQFQSRFDVIGRKATTQ